MRYEDTKGVYVQERKGEPNTCPKGEISKFGLMGFYVLYTIITKRGGMRWDSW
jgi:hypothetical protein